MCQINNVLHNTGDTPLICYKVLFCNPTSITSPYFRHCLWKLGETKCSEKSYYFRHCLWKLGETKCSEQSYFYGGSIGYGFFHAFTDKADAYYEKAKWAGLYLLEDYIIVEMEIPPYTYYYTGVTEDGSSSIATPVITFKQIL